MTEDKKKISEISFICDFIVKYIKLIGGLFVIALGIVVLLYSDIGLNPWNVFQQGISLHSSLSLGQSSQVVGFVLIISCLFFRIIPGVGTITNMVIVGIFVDLLTASGLFFTPEGFLPKLILSLIGIIINAFGTVVYISQGIGAGPRDSLMMVITQKTRFKIATVRNSIEIAVLVVGYFLGGKVGIGTVLVSILTGPAIAKFFVMIKKNPKSMKQDNVIDTYKNFKNYFISLKEERDILKSVNK